MEDGEQETTTANGGEAGDGGTAEGQDATPETQDTGKGLLGSAMGEDDAGDEKKDEGTESRAGTSWWAGTDRPEWLPEQFWSPDAPEGERFNAEAFSKSWKDLRSQVKAKQPEVPEKPEDYVFEVPEGAKLEEDDPVLAGARAAAHKAGLSKDQFSAFAEEFLEAARQIAPPPIDYEGEKALLGEHADRIINGVDRWGKNLVKLGVWSPDDFEEIVELGSTARGIAALNKLRAHYTREQQIPTKAIDDGGLPSKDELYAAVRSEEYANDPAYREKITRQFEQVFGTDPAGTSESSLGMNR